MTAALIWHDRREDADCRKCFTCCGAPAASLGQPPSPACPDCFGTGCVFHAESYWQEVARWPPRDEGEVTP